jgi:type I restriction enzyme R subunit
LLTEYLRSAGYAPAHISAALHKLRTEANHPGCALLGNNQVVYQLLRYGVPAQTEAGAMTQTVHLFDWKAPEKNHFALAEEVALHGKQQRRPDLVLSPAVLAERTGAQFVVHQAVAVPEA